MLILLTGQVTHLYFVSKNDAKFLAGRKEKMLRYILALLVCLVVAEEVVLKDDCEALAEQIRLFHLEADLYPFKEMYPQEDFRKQLHQKYTQCCSKVLEFGFE